MYLLMVRDFKSETQVLLMLRLPLRSDQLQCQRNLDAQIKDLDAQFPGTEQISNLKDNRCFDKKGHTLKQ